MRYGLVILMPLIFFLQFSWGHGDEVHSGDTEQEDEWETVTEKVPKETLDLIALEYKNTIKPIFQKKCYDCHGSGNKTPWYHVLPGAKQLMNQDMVEAKEHMDMTNGFPFSGHGTPRDDLISLGKTIKENSMPPMKYLIMHWGNSLSEKDKKSINKWIDNSLNQIKEN